MLTVFALATSLLSNVTTSVSLDQCLHERLVLRDVTITDGSGRWNHQDVLIENGRFTAMGSELEIESEAGIEELATAGAVISPLVERDVILIQASFSAETAMLMVGEDANFSLTAADGSHLADFRQGQPVGQCGL